MDAPELRDRTQRFSVRVGRFAEPMQSDPGLWSLRDQLQRAAQSLALNYSAACRGRNHDEFVAKICIATEEADETVNCLEMLQQSHGALFEDLVDILDEATQLLKILSASKRTALRNQLERRQRAAAKGRR